MDEPKDDFQSQGGDGTTPEWDDWPGEEVEPDEEDLAAIAEIEAGRFISNEAVMRWLEAISRGERPPRPQPGE